MTASPAPAGSRFAIAALHLFALWAFAVAQPIYDLLGRYATFFAAHDAGPSDVLLFALALSLALPAILVLLEALVALVSARLYRAFHLALVALLLALIVLPPINRSAAPAAVLALPVAALAGGIGAFAYARVAAVRTLCTVLAPSALLFPALFLLASPVAELVQPPVTGTAQRLAAANPAPVVVVVFDELSLFALMTERREIDAVRFPNFAALARDATWYRNATSVADYTPLAVPAILTGRLPDHNRLPVASEHPRNLFTLLGGTYRLELVEPVTELCPPSLCPRPLAASESAARTGALVSDAALIYVHMIAPRDLRVRLPGIARQWSFEFQRRFFPALFKATQSDRARGFTRFLAQLTPTDQPTLYFLHTLLPHYPYEYLPSGVRYNEPPVDYRRPNVDVGRLTQLLAKPSWTAEDAGAGLDDLTNPNWAVDNPEGARQDHLRYLLQLAFVDSLLGQMVERLRQTGLYDRALLVVTADHGVSFRPGQSQRFVTEDNHTDIMWVPLFVKLPHQQEGAIDDRNVETIDILPTIADALGVAMPWPVDGRSLLSAGPEHADKVILSPTGLFNLLDLRRLVVPPAAPTLPEALAHQLRLFGSGTPAVQLLAMGPFADLVGREPGPGSRAVDAPYRLRLTAPEQYHSVHPRRGEVPSFIHGHLDVVGDAPRRATLAVAVNNVVRAVTETFTEPDGRMAFGVLAPESAFRPGVNRVEIFAITADGAAPALRLVPAAES